MRQREYIGNNPDYIDGIEEQRLESGTYHGGIRFGASTDGTCWQTIDVTPETLAELLTVGEIQAILKHKHRLNRHSPDVTSLQKDEYSHRNHNKEYVDVTET